MGYGTKLHLVYGITDDEEDVLGNIHLLKNDPLYYDSEGVGIEVDDLEWVIVQESVTLLPNKNGRNPNFYIGSQIAEFRMLAGAIPLDEIDKHKKIFESNPEVRRTVDSEIDKLPEWFKSMFQDCTPKLQLIWSED